MRIFGGHDYYDGVAGQWYDPALVFTRQVAKSDEVRKVIKKECPLTRINRWKLLHIEATSKHSTVVGNYDIEYRHKRYTMYPITVYFAGKRYGGMWLNAGYGYSREEYSDEFFWSYEEFTKFLARHGFKELPARNYAWMNGDDDYKIESLKDHFEHEGYDSDREWLIENRITIAYDGTHSYYDNKDAWVIDCDGLKEIGFASRLDPYTAFQELSMWFGGVLPRDGNPMVEITDDKMKIQKAGFDKVTSFRNMK